MYNDIDLDTIDITKAAPCEEPDRQYYFMAKARKHVQDLAAELGRTPTCCVTTFGCQMNARDSEKLVGILEVVGYQIVETEMQILLFSIPARFVRMPICVYTADLVS